MIAQIKGLTKPHISSSLAWKLWQKYEGVMAEIAYILLQLCDLPSELIIW